MWLVIIIILDGFLHGNNLSRCIFHVYSATLATFVSQVEIETPNYIYLVFSPRVIYENVDNVFIEIDRIREVFKESLISGS
jgi:hypothetical protein